MDCQTCGHYSLYQMITSGKPYGYSGEIPCLRCSRYSPVEDLHTNKITRPAPEAKSLRLCRDCLKPVVGERWKPSKYNPVKTDWCVRCEHRRETVLVETGTAPEEGE